MEWRVHPLVDVDVELLVVQKHCVKSLSEWMLGKGLYFVLNLLVSYEEMSCLERNHNQRYFTLEDKDSLERARVTVDVELSGRGDISFLDSPSHHDYLLDLAFDVWKSHQK